jgi:phosphatidylglycerophosphate synthase
MAFKPDGSRYAQKALTLMFIWPREGERVMTSSVVLLVLRLCLVPVIVWSFPRNTLLAGIAIALFISVDIYDGSRARAHAADGPARRSLDIFGDRVATWGTCGAAVYLGFLHPLLFSAFLVRELYCAYWCYRIRSERYVAIRADAPYRLLSLSLATWVLLAPVISHGGRTFFFAAIIAWSVCLSVDFTRLACEALRLPNAARGSVVAAASLRELRRREGSRLGARSHPVPLSVTRIWARAE